MLHSNFSPLEQFDIIHLLGIYLGTWDLSFVHTILPLVVLVLVVLHSSYYLRVKASLVPTTIQIISELFVIFIINLIVQQIGKKGLVYLPFVSSIFLFVLSMNIFGLLPFGIALTSHVILIMWLSHSICLGIFILGFLHQGLKFLKLFIPEAPALLLPMLIFIEIFSYILRSFSLAIRLAANIMAGHTLVFIIASSIMTLLSISIWLLPIGALMIFPVLILEIGVAVLQAYVFSILVCIYFSEALNEIKH